MFNYADYCNDGSGYGLAEFEESVEKSASGAVAPPPQINVTFESSWSAFIAVFKERITERLSWVLTRLVKDRRSRVEWLERKWRSPMFGKKKWVVWCVRGGETGVIQ